MLADINFVPALIAAVNLQNAFTRAPTVRGVAQPPEVQEACLRILKLKEFASFAICHDFYSKSGIELSGLGILGDKGDILNTIHVLS